IAKPIGFPAIEQRDNESPAAPEREERRSIVAARTPTSMKDDRPRRQQPRIHALDAIRNPLVETRDSSRELHRHPAFSRPNPPPTHRVSLSGEIGDVAASMCMEMIETRERPDSRTVEPELVVRTSCGGRLAGAVSD